MYIDSTKKRKEEDLTQKSKKVKLEDEPEQVKEADEEEEKDEEQKPVQLNSALILTILRQVDLKRKCLDHIVQVLNQTLSYVTSSLSTNEKENDSGSSSSTSPSMEQLEEELTSSDANIANIAKEQLDTN